MNTPQRLVESAAALLDAGGEGAVTLRAVAQAVGVSHNAPYKHFESRNALLGAVAIRDFNMLTETCAAIRQLEIKPLPKLERALARLILYSQQSPARYKLLFSDPDIAAQGGELEAAALRSFGEFAAIVRACQEAGELPDVPNAELTGLIYASVHGLIDIRASGRMRQEKGLADVDKGVKLLLKLLRQNGRPA